MLPSYHLLYFEESIVLLLALLPKFIALIFNNLDLFLFLWFCDFLIVIQFLILYFQFLHFIDYLQILWVYFRLSLEVNWFTEIVSIFTQWKRLRIQFTYFSIDPFVECMSWSHNQAAWYQKTISIDNVSFVAEFDNSDVVVRADSVLVCANWWLSRLLLF